jgi:aminoglycoside phosphotransferase (APT) family kinase protein
MSPALDGAGTVRAGEELPVAALLPWLEENVPEFRAAALSTRAALDVQQFPGGYSNLTYLLRHGGREWVLRRPPVGSRVKTAHDMGREFRILSRLGDHYPKAPRALAACDDLSILGAPFYVMERMRGVILRGRDAAEAVLLPPATRHRVGLAVIDGLAELHAVDYGAAGLGDLGHPEGYVARQVHGWGERWQNSRIDPLEHLDRAAAWLAANLPAARGIALVHNDYKFDNLVLDPTDLTRVVALLDWEMATIADPLMDLGTTLGYWVDPEDGEALRALAFGPTTLPGGLRRLDVVQRYAERSGRDVDGILFYYVFGVFKIAVIAQQIYVRYRQGLTKDPRFAHLGEGVRALAQAAALAIGKGRIDRLEQ